MASCGVSGVSEKDMLEKYFAMSDRGVQRDEKTFKTMVMPNLEQLRKGDKSISAIERVQFGKPTQVWQQKWASCYL